MHKHNIKREAFKHALLTTLYISLVASLMNYSGSLFGDEFTLLAPIAMLMLFVLSALIVGLLILGKPIMLYLDGEKQTATDLLKKTGLWLSVLTVIAFLALTLV
jgi:hypothetical protein